MDCPAARRGGARFSRRAAVALLLAPLTLVACSGGTEPARATSLAIVTPAPSAASSGVALSQAPVVELRDGSGAPFASAGITITASIDGVIATLGGTTTHTTDANGRAVFDGLVISGTAGSYTLKFAASGLTAATSTAVALGAGPAATITVSPASLQGTVGAALTTLPAVTVKDASGNPVAGVSVDFSATAGTTSGTRQVTNAAGVATLGGWTLPTQAGQHQLSIASVAPVALSGIVVFATATPGAPATMIPTGGGQSALYSGMLTTLLQVRLVDQYGNPTPGVVVTWGSFTGAGTAAPLNVATDADGIVRATYRLGSMPGPNVIRASVNPLGLTTDFTATAKGFSDLLSVSMQHGCALDEDGAAYCWGQNLRGQVGDGTTTQRNVATAVSGGLRFLRISTHGWITCGIAMGDVAYCWGSNTWAGIGDGTTVDRSIPTEVAGLRFREISAGGATTCAIATGSNAAYCWGANRRGELGAGAAVLESCTTTDAPSGATSTFPCSKRPIAVDGGHSWNSISAGGSHVCALTANGEMYCWGEALSWGGSNGIPTSTPSPVAVAPTMRFSDVTAGGNYTCGREQSSGAVYCWGVGLFGELGAGAGVTDQRTPLKVVASALQVDAGQYGTCTVLSDARALCWGFNQSGAVGDGTTTNRFVPTQVVIGFSITSISASGDHSCARLDSGQLVCWGNTSEGQLGSGSGTGIAPAPQLVHP
jgi:alpha-tubulin suppressor-like RCC1 family protein